MSGSCLVQPLCPVPGQLEQITQDCIPSNYEYLEGLRLYMDCSLWATCSNVWLPSREINLCLNKILVFQLTPFLSHHQALQRRICLVYFTLLYSSIFIHEWSLPFSLILSNISFLNLSVPLTSFGPWLDLLQSVHAVLQVFPTVQNRGKDHLPRPAGSFSSWCSSGGCWLICHRGAVPAHVQRVHQDTQLPLWKAAFQLVHPQHVLVCGVILPQMYLPFNLEDAVSPVLQVVVPFA